MNSIPFALRHDVDLTSLCMEGTRIRLRSICVGDAEAIFEGFSPAITQYMLPKPAEAIEETMAFIHDSLNGMRSKSDLVFVVLKRGDAEFLGCCGLHGRGNPRTPELGIWIKQEAHGHGYGREAIRLACHWALEAMDFDHLIYPVDRRNIPSRRIPESMGGEIFDERRETTMRGTELDEVVFKLTPETIAAN